MSNPIRGTVAWRDAGASLVQAGPARLRPSFTFAKFPSGGHGGVRACLDDWKPQRVIATGGGAARLERELTGLRVHTVPEFAAWARGAPLLAARDGPRAAAARTCWCRSAPARPCSRSTAAARRGSAAARSAAARCSGSGGSCSAWRRFDEICALAARGDRRRSTCWSATSTPAARSRCRRS